MPISSYVAASHRHRDKDHRDRAHTCDGATMAKARRAAQMAAAKKQAAEDSNNNLPNISQPDLTNTKNTEPSFVNVNSPYLFYHPDHHSFRARTSSTASTIRSSVSGTTSSRASSSTSIAESAPPKPRLSIYPT